MSNDIIERIAMVRQAVEECRSQIVRLTDSDSRERAIALTKLDEARLWAIEAVTLPVSDHTPR